jgi:nucleotide-binding universal stress UspA family protein
MLADCRASHARHPLVVAESGKLGCAALSAGIDCARATSGRLFVMTVARQVHPFWMGGAPTCTALIPAQMFDDIDGGEQTLAAARRQVPADMPLRTQLITEASRARAQVLETAEAFGCDLIIVPGSPVLGHLRLGLGASLRRTSSIPVQIIESRWAPGEAGYEHGLADHAAVLEIA